MKIRVIRPLLTIGTAIAGCVYALPAQLGSTSPSTTRAYTTRRAPPHVDNDDAVNILSYHNYTTNRGPAAPYLREINDLWRRFEILECWDAHQRHDWGEWICSNHLFRREGHRWQDPFDIWEASNHDARATLGDPMKDPGRFSHREDACCGVYATTSWASFWQYRPKSGD